jgi:hypothetical protein
MHQDNLEHFTALLPVSHLCREDAAVIARIPRQKVTEVAPEQRPKEGT